MIEFGECVFACVCTGWICLAAGWMLGIRDRKRMPLRPHMDDRS